ncbi:hypothetical protein IP84_13915 [beta proteobacterium AAP99]|nr:hypothetical protein IP84_13915 [beta proteobacterium AAP99]
MPEIAAQPAPSLTGPQGSIRAFLLEHAPFSQMTAPALNSLLAGLELCYFADGEQLLAPESQPPTHWFIVKQGSVKGIRSGANGGSPEPLFMAAGGECFPVGALLAQRPVTLSYQAVGDTFVFRAPRELFEELTRKSPAFMDFCTRRLAALLDQSRRELQASVSASTHLEQNLLTPLAAVVRRAPVTCAPSTPLGEALATMQSEKLGSILVTQADGALAGILTRSDLIGRVLLPQLPLSTPIEQVMSQPVHCLSADASAADAVYLMGSKGVRHVAVLQPADAASAAAPALLGVVSERDLFALQRLSLRSAGSAIRRAQSIDSLAAAARDIRGLARNLVAQGVGSAQITRFVSMLNDQLTQRIIELSLERYRLVGGRFCWLALGSEGREEQTIATDQDNALLLAADEAPRRDAWLVFAASVNNALAACGFPLCKGGVMARNPALCLTLDEWQARFGGWMEAGDPQALLNASIYFDFRGLAGDLTLAHELRRWVGAQVKANGRFLKQLTDNALTNHPPIAWTGGMIDQLLGPGQDRPVDLKLSGTMPLVDGARILSLAHGIAATNTVERFHALVSAGAADAADVAGWVDAFHFLQMLRLRVQIEGQGGDAPQADAENPNRIDPAQLSSLDRRILKEAFRQAKKLQQRVALDYV